jgi:hypothetical protein
MDHAALVARFRQEIRDAPDKAPAGVGNDQLHALQAVTGMSSHVSGNQRARA